MKIGIDARFYGSAGGLARYTQQLINHLAQIDLTNQYVIFLGKTNLHEFSPQQILRNKDSKENQEDNKTAFKKIMADVKWYTLKEQILMPWKIWRAKVETNGRSSLYKAETNGRSSLQLMHFPHWNVPLLFRGRFVVTIHDLILLKYPSKKATTLNPLFFAIKYWAYKKVLAHAIYDSLKIIVPSEFVKKDILAHFQVPAEKIMVIYEGRPPLPPFRKEETEEESSSLTRKVRENQQLNNLAIKPYLLYVGVAYPHKNLEGLIKAFQIFCDKYSRDYHLVLAGQENYFYRRLQKQFNNLTIKQLINFLGFVPDSRLPELYKNASLYVFPSFYEGFGLPALEAMSYGLPVIASDNSCLPEILGDAAYYFNPHHPEEIAVAINKVLTDQNLRESLRQKGYEQVKKYSWEKCGQQTLEVYKQISGNKV